MACNGFRLPLRSHQVQYRRVVVDAESLALGVRSVVQHVDGVAFLFEPALNSGTRQGDDTS
jgi:hypothetical protein